MTKTSGLLILVILVSQFAYPQAPESKVASLKLGYVKSADDGCGCSFSYNLAEFWKDKHLFVSPMDEATFINVDGKDVELRPISQSKENMDEKVGDRSWQTYVAGDLKVRVDYTVTKICDPNNENRRQTSESTKRMVHWPENPINYANTKSADYQMLEQIDMVEITDITAGGKSITLGQSFEADDEWLKTLSVRIKNVSQVTISKAQMNFFLPQLMPGGPLVALCYGCAGVGKGETIDPGEEVEMKLLYYSWLLDQINSKSSLSKITRAEVWHIRITFLDGRQFVSGCIKTADLKNVCPKPEQ